AGRAGAEHVRVRRPAAPGAHHLGTAPAGGGGGGAAQQGVGALAGAWVPFNRRGALQLLLCVRAALAVCLSSLTTYHGQRPETFD
ncbi:hypothetical protein VM98_37720, partial [Streptomyces rubellomurinus subsp. indigoferus]